MKRTPLSEGFGQRALRARLHLAVKRGKTVSQVEIGQALSTTGQTVGRWESGTEPETLADLEALAEALEVNPWWLAFGYGEMESENHHELRQPTRGRKVPKSAELKNPKRGLG